MVYFFSSLRFPFHILRHSDRTSRFVLCQGLTVLELVVAMGVAGLFYGVLYNFYQLHARALKVQEIRLDLQESSRLAIDFLVRELHFAGARPAQRHGGTGFA